MHNYQKRASARYQQLKTKYFQMLHRLQSAVNSGQFAQWSRRKQTQLKRRLQRYLRRLDLGTSHRTSALGAKALLLGSALTWQVPANLVGQSFESQQNFIFSSPFGLEDSSPRSLSLVDIDGDGDLDAFIGGSSFKFFLNTSTDTAVPAFSVDTNSEPFGISDVGSQINATFVDIDGDGDLDAFIGEFDGNTNFFKNTGTSTSPAFSLDTNSEPFGLSDPVNPIRYSSPTFIDIDGDGDLDAFIGERDGNTNFYRNIGTSTSPTFSLDTNTTPFGIGEVSNNSQPTFVDIDGDGDLDALIGDGNGNTNFFKNTSTNNSIPAFNLVSDSMPFGLCDVYRDSKPTFIDIDGDGDLDALISGTQNISFFRNTGTSTSPAFNCSIFGLSDIGRKSSPSFIDIDGDGDLDAFIGDSDGNTNFFRNNGDCTGPDFSLESSSNAFGIGNIGRNSSPVFVDIDGDGDLDAFIGEDDQRVNFFENTSTDSSIPAFSLNTSSAPFGISISTNYLTPSFVDIDGDGDLDAFIGQNGNKVSFFENTGTSSTPAFTLDTNSTPFGLGVGASLGFNNDPTFADIDGDGDIDAFVQGNGAIIFFKNTGTSSAPAFSVDTNTAPFGININGIRSSSPEFVDIDGDGDLDAFIGENSGKIIFLENTDNIKNTPVIAIEGNSMNITAGDNSPSTMDDTDFGNALIAGGMVTKTFTIKNTLTGRLRLLGNPVVSIDNSTDFSISTQPLGNTISANKSLTFTVKFDPISIGTKMATISIANSNCDISPFDFKIQGTGIVPPEIAVEGNSINIADGDTSPAMTDSTDFGNALVADSMVSKTFTIKNTGAGPLNLSGSPIVSIDNTTDFMVTSQPFASTIAANSLLTFTVKFDPASTGTKMATISIANNDSDENPFDFKIQGKGTVPEIAIEGNSMDIADGDTSPTMIDSTDFSSALVADSMVFKTFTIKNTGTGPLNLSGSPIVSIDNTTDFMVTSQPSANTIAANGLLTFTIKFDPVSTGTKTATISIANNDSDEDPFDFMIQGTGTAPEIAVEGNSMDIPDGDTSPATTDDTDFGNTLVLDGMVSKTFTIKNTGTGALALSGTPLISIDNTTDFMVTSQPSASTITANGMLTFTIKFDPASVGTKMATITIANSDSDENPFDFKIQGMGMNGMITGIVDNQNADFSIADPCSCTDPQNVRLASGEYLFHDILTVMGTSGQPLDILAPNDGEFLNVSGNPIPLPMSLTETSSGIWQLDFYHRSGKVTNLTLQMNNDAATNMPFVSSRCDEEVCFPADPIPTMNQWGLMIFGLLLLNLGVLGIREKEAEDNFL